MHSVEQALADLARVDPSVVDDARAAWEALAGNGGTQDVTQWRLQHYLWHDLPRSLPTAPQRRWQVAMGLGALLEALGMPRYAALCRGPVTEAILLSGETGIDRDSREVRRAMQRSGVEPPDTELLTWSSVMGPSERAAMEAVANTLELTVAVGLLAPGGRGWRDQQADIAVSVLTSANPGFGGRVPYEDILAERLQGWVRGTGSTTRTSVLAPLQNGLRLPVDPVSPAVVRMMLRPLDWLLTEVGDGLVLTAAGYLPPRTVARALDDLNWRDHVPGPATREADAHPVLVLRATAHRLGLIRRRGNRLLLTPSGRDALHDGRMLWNSVTAALIGPEHSALALTWEIVAGVLVGGDAVLQSELQDMVTAAVAESGWRAVGRREPGDADTGPLFHAVLRDLRWLELVEEHGPLHEPMVRARPGVPDLLRAALRSRVLHREIVA